MDGEIKSGDIFDVKGRRCVVLECFEEVVKTASFNEQEFEDYTNETYNTLYKAEFIININYI